MKNTSPFDKPDLADSILETCDDLCKELNLIFFLSFGTCLGFYRDGDYIEGDNDIDVVIVASHDEWVNLWNALCSQPGFDGHRGLRKGNIQLDLQRTEREPPYITPSPRSYTFQDFDTVFHCGRGYKVPRPIEVYLEREYSESWRTPLPTEAWETLKASLLAGTSGS